VGNQTNLDLSAVMLAEKSVENVGTSGENGKGAKIG
jgi:hypothetical protein